ncbi:MAG: CHASE domain-containing protein [Planctomycetaceae bacterium]
MQVPTKTQTPVRENNVVSAPTKKSHSLRIASGVLLLSLGLTLWASHATKQHIASQNVVRFSTRTAELQQRIEDRFHTYEDIFRNAVALHAASDEVSQSEWHDYADHAELRRFYPAIQTIGVVKLVPNDTRSTHVKDARASSSNTYDIQPAGNRDTYGPIVRVEPFRWRHELKFGFDLYSVSSLQPAMEEAIITGRPSIAGPTFIETEDEASICCFLPMYKKDAPLETTAERKAAANGWIFGTLSCRKLLESITAGQLSDVAFQLSDTDGAEERILFRSEPAAAEMHVGLKKENKQLRVGGRDWALSIWPKQEFSGKDATTASMVLCIGIIFDLLLFTLIYMLGRQREIARAIAKDITSDLRRTELHTRLILDNASEAIISVSQAGTITRANAAARYMFGLKKALIGTQFNRLLADATIGKLVTGPANTSRTAVTCQRDDSSTFPANAAVSRIVSDEGANSFIVVLRDETERIKAEQEVAEINKQLINSSKKAAVAEVATGVLHNVGNALNSVATSSGAISRSLKTSPASQLAKAIDILEKNRENIAEFLDEDPRGRHCIEYLKVATKALVEQDASISAENERLLGCAQHIREIIRSQQEQAKANPTLHLESAADLMDQAVNLNNGRHAGYGIQLTRDYHDCPEVVTDRHKVLQILTNLIANAHDAVREVEDRLPLVTVATRVVGTSIEFAVVDNGVGIAPEDLGKIKTFGFTTKEDGHGFGLHSCVRAARSIGGEIELRSDGLNRGATFSLVLPLEPEQVSAELANC